MRIFVTRSTQDHQNSLSEEGMNTFAFICVLRNFLHAIASRRCYARAFVECAPRATRSHQGAAAKISPAKP